MSHPADVLQVIGLRLLDLAVTSIENAPERRLVAAGTAPRDFCPQVSVTLVNLATTADPLVPLPTSARTAPCPVVLPMATWTVEVVRCVPAAAMPTPARPIPSADAQTDAAAVVVADALALWQALTLGLASGTLFADLYRRVPAMVGTVTPFIEGAAMGVSVPFVAALPG